MTKQELKELITPEFLSTLHSAVECCGWDVDMVEKYPNRKVIAVIRK